ncbi:hypothetical protein HY086_03140 [Candidatus Gottesmanbacteria bacterium]|nr:hypothetical protein [Candidatus Gottesmanbacteria bacterium]
MKNAKVFIPIILGVLVGGGGAGLFLLSKQEKMAKPAMTALAPTSAPVEMATWKDQAGFTFGYPKDISFNPHDEDKDNFAHVELTHKDHPGKIIVWAKDVPAADLAAWVKKEKRFAAASILDTTLGGKPAKKILISDPTKMIVVGAIDSDVLITIEGELADGDYWSKVHQGIVDSFTFAASLPSGDTSGGADEEETIE